MEVSYRFRIYLLTTVVLVGFGVLVTRLYEFQIGRRTEFLAQVPSNSTVMVREPGVRGEIVDRNGVVLAKNLRKYEVRFNLDEIQEAHKLQHEEKKLERYVEQRGLPRAAGKETDIAAIVMEGDSSVLSRLQQMGLASKDFSKGALVAHYRTHKGLVPFSYRTDLTFEDFSKFAEHASELPGVNLGMRPVRVYPYGSLASHVLGYMKQWEKGDIPENATRVYKHYIGDDKGIAGIESTLDEHLRGVEGKKTVVKDEKNRVIKVKDYTKPGMGAKVQLTLDARLQYLLENTLRYAGRAAGVLMDVRTGEVLAMASVPDFDPNNFIPSITAEKLDAYAANKQLSPFTNRSISAFTPGSTMKVAASVAAAYAGVADRTYSCDGFVTYGNKNVGCWIWNQSKGSHGPVNISQALQKSCNPYFNKMANAIGWKAMVEGCQLVGIGKRTGVELPREDAGVLPGSKEWRAAKPNTAMTPALTAFLSIGQGDTLATPLQLCAMTAAVANGGKYYRPRLVKKVVNQDGQTVIGDEPELVVDLEKSGVHQKDLERIRKGMWMSTNDPGGTTGKAKLAKYEIASKSGTAQTTDNGKKSNNSWIISFAPYDQPRYALCILVQNGGSGGGVCGPLAALVFRGIHAQEQGVKLALKPQREVLGNTDRIEKAIDIPLDVIAAVESGNTQFSPKGATSLANQENAPMDTETLGDTEADVGEDGIGVSPSFDTQENPKPTLTPTLDDEGKPIPRAIPVNPR